METLKRWLINALALVFAAVGVWVFWTAEYYAALAVVVGIAALIAINVVREKRQRRADAWWIELRDGHNFLYAEGERKVLISGEMLAGDTDFVIYSSDIKRWQPPFESENIDQIKKEEILARLDIFMKRQGMKYRLD